MDFIIPEELKMVQTMVSDFVDDQLLPLEREVLGRDDLTGRMARLTPEMEEKLIKMVKGMGLWGLSIPKELGGVGLGTLGTCLVEEELAKTIVPFDFGNVTPILFDCNEEQRERYLLPLLQKQKCAYLALIESGRGSDPSGMEMRAEKINGGYRLDGRKVVLSRLDDCDFAVVFAVTNPGVGIRGGVTCFMVDSDTQGFTVVRSKDKPGRQALGVEPISLIFDRCQVPSEGILGEEGKAFNLGKEWLPARRIVRGARHLGAAERLLKVSIERAKTWENFGQSVSGWHHMQAALAEMAIDVQATRLMVYHAAWKADEGKDIHQEAAMVKVFAIEMVHRVADRVVQIHGGPMYAEELSVERLCRNLISTMAVEYALELQKAIIATDILKSDGRLN